VPVAGSIEWLLLFLPTRKVTVEGFLVVEVVEVVEVVVVVVLPAEVAVCRPASSVPLQYSSVSAAPLELGRPNIQMQRA
jgi:hypothetical protein